MNPTKPMRNPNKTKSVRELGKVEITDLQKKVFDIAPEIWEKHNASKPNKFGVFNTTEHIVFRFIDDFRDHRQFHDRPLWNEWEQLIAPIMKMAVTPYGYEKGAHPRIMLAKLKAGSEIGRHIDGAPAAKFPHKIHVPISTNSDCFFKVGGQSFHMKEGEAYEVNNNDMHSAVNEGDTDRIHLIFEYYPLN